MAEGFSGARKSSLRVGHAEREAIAAELREHYASGRLTLEELNERLDAALAAKTRADLDALMTDLPPSGPSTDTGPIKNGGSGRDSWRGVGAAIAARALTAVMLCVLLTVGLFGVFGLGLDRPVGIVLLLAALAFMRRLLFGRRRPRCHPGPGPRSRRRW